MPSAGDDNKESSVFLSISSLVQAAHETISAPQLRCMAAYSGLDWDHRLDLCGSNCYLLPSRRIDSRDFK
jgi:hypothetical protein